jgi:protein-S-isoprenylcysteine O-methyltransferase Ste14
MDVARYLFAVLWLVSYPILLFWIGLHPFASFWRRMGLAATYVILLAACVSVSVVLFRFRGPLLSVEYGTHPALWFLAAGSYGLAVSVELRCRKHLKLSTLVGVPELRGTTSEQTLLSQGIYGQMRHPRYVGAALGYLASVFFANYLILYAALPVFLVLLHLIVVLEERELEERFGEEYRVYRASVPRYLPRSLQRYVSRFRGA